MLMCLLVLILVGCPANHLARLNGPGSRSQPMVVYGSIREVHRSERHEFARSERHLFTRSDRRHVNKDLS